MKVNACFCIVQLLLFARELDGVSQWELPVNERKPSIEPKGSNDQDVWIWQRQQLSPGSRRDVRRLLISKVSSVALQYGLAWVGWRKKHKKSYANSQEELERYIAWRSNTVYIQYHNKYADTFGFSLAMNNYGDMVKN